MSKRKIHESSPMEHGKATDAPSASDNGSTNSGGSAVSHTNSDATNHSHHSAGGGRVAGTVIHSHPLPPSLHPYAMPIVPSPYHMPPIVSPVPSYAHPPPGSVAGTCATTAHQGGSSPLTVSPQMHMPLVPPPMPCHPYHHHHCVGLPPPPPLATAATTPSTPPPTTSSSSSRHVYETLVSAIDLELRAVMDQESFILERAASSPTPSSSSSPPHPHETNHQQQRNNNGHNVFSEKSTWGNLMIRLLCDTNRRKRQLQHQKDQVLQDLLASVSTSSPSLSNSSSSSPVSRDGDIRGTNHHQHHRQHDNHRHIPLSRHNQHTTKRSMNSQVKICVKKSTGPSSAGITLQSHSQPSKSHSHSHSQYHPPKHTSNGNTMTLCDEDRVGFPPQRGVGDWDRHNKKQKKKKIARTNSSDSNPNPVSAVTVADAAAKSIRVKE